MERLRRLILPGIIANDANVTLEVPKPKKGEAPVADVAIPVTPVGAPVAVTVSHKQMRAAPGSVWTCTGDPTEAALITLAMKV